MRVEVTPTPSQLIRARCIALREPTLLCCTRPAAISLATLALRAHANLTSATRTRQQSPRFLGQHPAPSRVVFWTRARRSATPTLGASLSRRGRQQGSGCHPGLCTFSAPLGYANVDTARNF